MKAVLVIGGKIYWSRKALVDELEISKTTLWNWQNQGIIPAPTIWIGRSPYWDIELIDRALTGETAE